jgi:hypothetical protein
MFRVLQIKCRAQVSGERERDVKISSALRRGEMTRVFLSRQSKNNPKRFSIGCILTIDKNFLLLLFFYCFRIMCNNRYLVLSVRIVKNGVFVAIGQRLMFISYAYPMELKIEVALLLFYPMGLKSEIDFVTDVSDTPT